MKNPRRPAAPPVPGETPPVPSCLLAVKAVPNAPRSEIAGWLGDALKVKLHAPPVDGRANAELCAFLAAQLGLPASAVALATGGSARLKHVRITGLTAADARQRLARVFPRG